MDKTGSPIASVTVTLNGLNDEKKYLEKMILSVVSSDSSFKIAYCDISASKKFTVLCAQIRIIHQIDNNKRGVY